MSVSALVFEISREKISEPAGIVKGVSPPRAWLACARLASNQDRTTSSLPLMDHRQGNACHATGSCLPYHSLQDTKSTAYPSPPAAG